VTSINVDTIESSTSTLTIGASGNSVVAADSVNVNLVKDASGATMWESDGSGVLSNVNAGFGDDLVLLNTTTASNTANVTYTLTNTYKEFIIKCISINPVTDDVSLQFQLSNDGTNYNKTITSTFWVAYNTETGSPTGLTYDGLHDQAQGTAFQTFFKEVGNDADQACSAELHLFNPSSTTFAKNFYVRATGTLYHQYIQDQYTAGYINDTAAMTSIRFQMSSGNINSGKIKMYGVK
jgi:hypothetical protein